MKNKKHGLKSLPTAQAPEIQESDLAHGAILDMKNAFRPKMGPLGS